jgi:predicted anti-sigma-YlaC factor YlaD
MIAPAHPVAPEDLMALLDGELAPQEAQAVSAHLNHCPECAQLALEFRSVSESLKSWTVPDAPPALEETVLAQAAQTVQSSHPQSPGAWSLLRWTMSGRGAVAAALILLAVSSAIFFHGGPSARKQRLTSFVNPGDDPRSIDGQLAASRKSREEIAEPRGVDSLVALAPGVAGVAKDSNGQFYDQPAPPPPSPAIAQGLIAGSAARRQDRSRSVADANDSQATAAIPAAAPMIARTVALSIVVKDFPAARAALDAILARHQGYSAQLTVNTEQNVQRGLQDSLRIPAPQLAAALAELKSLGRVETETQSGEEVTQQHADLVARLQNSRETEQRLRDILAQRTGKIEDVLQVEEEIARVRGEIEQMEADRQTLEHRVDFATVDLHIAEEYKEQFATPSTSASTQIRNAFVSGMRGAAATLLGILLFLEEAGPVILIWLAILALPAVLLWRRYRRLRTSI